MIDFPPPERDHGACIKDHSVLADLGNAMSESGQAAMNLADAAEDYFHGLEQQMTDGLDRMKCRLDMARRAEDAARQALAACRERRYWDEEKQEYVEPSCSCEERDLRDAEKEVRRLQEIVEKMESLRDEIELELGHYREGGGFAVLPGGDGILRDLGQRFKDSAVERMENIAEVVQKYLTVPVRPGVPAPEIPEAPTDMDCAGRSETLERKAEEFRLASERVRELAEDRDRGDRELRRPDGVAVCPNCHLPIVACRCPRDPRENYVMFHYNLDRSR